MSFSKRIEQLVQKHETIQSQLQYSRATRKSIRRREKHTRAAHAAALAVAGEIQKKTYRTLGGLVTKCIQSVFDTEMTFELVHTQKAGKTQVEFQFLKNGEPLDPMSSSSGGFVDVASFALRVAALLMSQPQVPLVLILDEPFRFVSVHARQAVRQMVESLSQDLGIQFIIVTHMKELACGEIIQIDE